MRIALLSDIHGNRQALEACLAHAAGQAAERLVFLGDLVGYGADPEWVVERVAAEVGRGALALLGNHDEAVLTGGGDLNRAAAAAVDWTRGRLDAAALAFLRGLPLVAEEEDRLYVHADASAPDAWHYVLDADAALRSLEATTQRLTFCGHTHLPRLFGITAASKLMSFQPVRRGAGAAAAAAPLAGGAGRGGAAAGRQPGRLLRHLRHREPGDVLAAGALRRGGGGGGDPRRRAAGHAGDAALRRALSMVRPRLDAGSTLDGFILGEVVHHGSMALLWSVTHPDHPGPLLMKLPRLFEGEDPAAIVSFEMEQMILPRLTGPHVPQRRRARRLHRPALYRHGAGAGGVALWPAGLAAASGRGGGGDRHRGGGGAGCAAPPACGASGPQALQHHPAAGRRRGAGRFRPLPPCPATGSDGGGVPPALRHRALHGAGAGGADPRRAGERPVCPRRDAGLLHHRRAALRRSAAAVGPAAAAVAGPGAAARRCGRTARPGCRR